MKTLLKITIIVSILFSLFILTVLMMQGIDLFLVIMASMITLISMTIFSFIVSFYFSETGMSFKERVMDFIHKYNLELTLLFTTLFIVSIVIAIIVPILIVRIIFTGVAIFTGIICFFIYIGLIMKIIYVIGAIILWIIYFYFILLF